MNFIKSLLAGIAISLFIFFTGISFILNLGFAGLVAGVVVMPLALVLILITMVISIRHGVRSQSNKLNLTESRLVKHLAIISIAICVLLLVLTNIRIFTVRIPNLINKPIAVNDLKNKVYLQPTYLPPGVQFKGASFYQPGQEPSYVISYDCNNTEGIRINQYFSGNPDYIRASVSDLTNQSAVSINGLTGNYGETWFSSDLYIDTNSNLKIDLHIYDKNKCNLENPKEELLKMVQSMKQQ